MAVEVHQRRFGPPEDRESLVVMELVAPREGPEVVVSANLHGDETTGIGSIHELIAHLKHHLVRGRIRLLPSLNPKGLTCGERGLPPDLHDLNRAFPGNGRGNPAERLAHAIWEEVTRPRPHLVIDLHADAGPAMPYVLLDRPVHRAGPDRAAHEVQLVRLATATGWTVLWDYPDRQYIGHRLDRSLAGSLVNRAHLPALTLEAGPRSYLDPVAVTATTDAVWGVLHHLGLVHRSPPPHPSRIPGCWRRAEGAPSKVSGIFTPCRLPGRRLEAHTAYAEIRSVTGMVLQSLSLEHPGFLVSLLDRTWVEPGCPVATLGQPEPAPP